MAACKFGAGSEDLRNKPVPAPWILLNTPIIQVVGKVLSLIAIKALACGIENRGPDACRSDIDGNQALGHVPSLAFFS